MSGFFPMHKKKHILALIKVPFELSRREDHKVSDKNMSNALFLSRL